MPGLIEIATKEIDVGTRYREEMGDLSDLVESIKAKGLIQPITITPDNTLLTGARRLKAVEMAGLDTIQAIVRETEDELDFREIELFENVHRKDLSWHERALLESEIFELKREKEGWSQREAAEAMQQSVGGLNRHLQLARAVKAMPELKKAPTERDAWKTVSKIKEAAVVDELASRGEKDRPDVVKYFGHNFRVQDALEGFKEMDDGCFGFAEVDPPYGVDLGTVKRAEGETDIGDYTDIEAKEYAKFIRAAAKQAFRVLKQDAFCVWWFGPTHFHTVKRELEKAGFIVCDVPAIWHREGPGQTQQPDYNLANCYEPFFVCRKGQPALRLQGRGNVFTYAPVPPSEKIHPTQKPLSLMTELLGIFAFPGYPVVVPFLGSGVTLYSAYQKKLPCLGWELSEDLKNRALLKAQEGYGG